MKRKLSLLLGVLALALVPAIAQEPAASSAPMGKVHGHVTNPSGAPQTNGSVTYLEITRAASGPGLSPQTAERGTFTVDANGDYTGSVPAGNYTVVYRSENMTKDQQADRFDNVKVVANQDTAQDIDMSRQEYIDKLPEEQKKQLEDLRKKNAAAMQANAVIKNLNADLKVVSQDLKDVDAAHATAEQQLGANAAKADVDAKTTEIKTAKYTDVTTLMTKDTELRPNEPVLWAYLGQADAGLKKYDDAETAYKKALDAVTASKKPNPAVEGMANAGLGEIYARAGKVPEANAAYDAAAKANPTSATMYLRNQAVIFFQSGNGDAQVAAAEIAIKNDPNDALVYYLKGQGLVQKATVDPKTSRIVLPDGCADAYQKYLELAPTGPYAGEVQAILQQAGQKINSSYKAGKK
ncbi:MAG TPA: carboxypeptidase-like regulatory domain-containing protein [Terracidiphilus sp.]|jgi:tetratricopeptide (TPR) repeat protein|nr:carboxypeptidase-like regulatory domain-containing protein [Terracidiphilus sp.]